MSTLPSIDRGMTDPVARFTPASLRPALDLVDQRAGVAVDDRGIEVRQLIRTRLVAWDEVTAISLDSRLDALIAAATRFLPIGRVPVVGGLVTDIVRVAATAVTRRVAPGVRDGAGWTLATIERDGVLRRDVDIDGGAFLTALFSPELSAALEAHAGVRHIPVQRR